MSRKLYNSVTYQYVNLIEHVSSLFVLSYGLRSIILLLFLSTHRIPYLSLFENEKYADMTDLVIEMKCINSNGR